MCGVLLMTNINGSANSNDNIMGQTNLELLFLETSIFAVDTLGLGVHVCLTEFQN